MDGVGPAQPMASGDVTGELLDSRGELDGARRSPELLPALLGRAATMCRQVMVAFGGGERGAHLGLRQAARQGGVTGVPECGRHVAAFLLDDRRSGPHAQARPEFAQRSGEPVQVLVGGAGDDVEVERLAACAVGLGTEATDDQAVDAVVGEDPRDAFRVELVNWHVVGSRLRGRC